MPRHSNAVTIYDVAKQAGVSVATVSRFINRKAPVSAEVADRLERVMAELKYTPKAAAQHLASQKTRVLGLLLTDMHNDFFAPLLKGAEEVVRKHRYNLLVASYRSDGHAAGSPPIGPHNTDGILVFADSLTDDEIKNLHASGFPVVLIHRSLPASSSISSVTVENKSATHKLIEHLIIHHNKKRILLMRGPVDQEDAYWREAGYKSALQANGIPFDEELVLNGQFERDIAREALGHFLRDEKQTRFDAIFTGDDDAAIGVLRALSEHGLRVPEDIAVVGFDDSRLSAFLNPPLTTVRAPTEMVGRIATEKLFDLLNDGSPDGLTLLPTEIIIRCSCGCNP